MPHPEVGFHHVDVFPPRAYPGNSLAVFVETVSVTRDGGTAATGTLHALPDIEQSIDRSRAGR